MPGLLALCDARLKRLTRSITGSQVHAVTSAEASTARTPTRASVLPKALDAVVIACEGEVWTLAFRNETVRLKDSLGMQYLGRLLAAPGQPIHALALAQAKLAPEAEIASALHTSDAGEELDATARAQYRARVQALRAELDEAESAQDAESAERIRGELTFVAAELSRAVGLSGRVRRAGSAAERARSAVQRRIKSALERITEVSPELAAFLETTVKTGTYCEYRPELSGRA
jgi:hypothetical protein